VRRSLISGANPSTPLSQTPNLRPRMRLSRPHHQPNPSRLIASHGDRGLLARLLLPAILLLSLAINPIGALIHAWQHLARVSAAYEKSLHTGGEICELCAAYAALEHATLPVPLHFERFAPESPALLLPESSPPATRLFHYHQRAPPAASA
jgi:hypothetical protein